MRYWFALTSCHYIPDISLHISGKDSYPLFSTLHHIAFLTVEENGAKTNLSHVTVYAD